jgi:opacity protein-like surface antigen
MHLLRRPPCIAVLIALAAALSLLPSQAQVVSSAHRDTKSLWVGGEYSNMRASFPYQSSQRLEGFGVFADFKLRRFLGFEGDARFLHDGGFEGSTESTYLVGPKTYFLSRGNLRPYARFLVGDARIHYPFDIGDASYFALAPAAGAGYKLGRRWMIRGEYEYQLWLNSPGFANQPRHELTPNGFHVGVAYRVFPWNRRLTADWSH